MSRSATPINRLKWRVEYFFYLLLELGLSFFSLASIYRLGELLGKIVYRFSAKYRGIVRRNLRMSLWTQGVACPEERLVEEVFEKNGGNLLTTIAAGSGRKMNLDAHIEIKGLEYLDDALERSGVILMLAHMGNWEILTKLTDVLRANNPLGALYRPLNNPHMNGLVLRKRGGAGMHLISSRNPAFQILELLKKKGVMCILSDQKIGKRGSIASFFGCPTYCTRLPLIMSEKAGAPLFTLSMRTLSAGRWEIRICPVEDSSQQGAMDSLAQTMSHSLVDCFWFQDRWQEFPTHAFLERGEQSESAVYKQKPLQGILESRALLERFPEIRKKLPESQYPLLYWEEGGDPELAYYAIGESKQFQAACQRVGLKKACLTPQAAMKRWKPSPS